MPHETPRTAYVSDRIVDVIATEADCYRRTVIRRLAGLPVRGRVETRVDRAIGHHLSQRAADSEAPPGR